MVEQAWGEPRRQLARSLRLAVPAAFLAASAVDMARYGVPQSPDRLLLWLTVLLACVAVSDIGRVRRLALEWLPLVALVFSYDLLRGQAAHLVRHAHVLPQIWIGRYVGDGTLPVLWLQHALWHGAHDIRWYDYACVAVYYSYFFVTPLLAAGLWLTGSPRFRAYAAMVVTLAFLGVATYAVFPAVPPWLASTGHYLPHVTQIVAVVSTHVGFLDTSALFEKGEAYANLVAAVPSLHAAFSMLAALVVGTLLRRRALRIALLLYPVAMGFALVYTGEHYTVDVVLGWLYAVAVFRLVSRFARIESAHARSAGDHGRRLPCRR